MLNNNKKKQQQKDKIPLETFCTAAVISDTQSASMVTASYNAAQRVYDEEIPDVTLVSLSLAAALSCPA